MAAKVFHVSIITKPVFSKVGALSVLVSCSGEQMGVLSDCGLQSSAGTSLSILGGADRLTLEELESNTAPGVLLESKKRPSSASLSEFRSTSDTSLVPYRCSGYLETADDDLNGKTEFFLWTSLHCFSPLEHQDYTVSLFDPKQGVYLSSQIDIPLVGVAQNLRRKFETLEIQGPEWEELMASFLNDFHSRVSAQQDQISQACFEARKNMNLADDSDLSTLCINGFDTIRLPITFENTQEDFSSALQEFEERFEERPSVISNSNLSFQNQFLLQNWSQVYRSYSESLLDLYLSDFAQRKSDVGSECTSGQETPLCSLDAWLVEAGWNVTKTPQQALSSLRNAQSLLLAGRPFAKSLLSVDGGKRQEQLSFHGHFERSLVAPDELVRRSEATVGQDGFETLFHLSFPLSELVGRKLVDEDFLGDLSLPLEILKVPSDELALAFQGGDSGTMMLFLDHFPIGSLSSVDGVPRTGGLSSFPLPDGEINTVSPGEPAPPFASGGEAMPVTSKELMESVSPAEGPLEDTLAAERDLVPSEVEMDRLPSEVKPVKTQPLGSRTGGASSEFESSEALESEKRVEPRSANAEESRVSIGDCAF